MTLPLDSPQTHIEAALAEAATHDVRCRIALPLQSGESLLQLADVHNVTDFAVNSTRQLTDVDDRDCESLQISRPQTYHELRLATDAHLNPRVHWVIDHFVHAEQLAAAGLSQTQHILIQLQSPQPGFGVRPGTDAVQLAHGIEGLQGVRVEGLALHATLNDDLDALLQAARFTCDRLRSQGICCDTVSLTASCRIPLSDISTFTELLIEPPASKAPIPTPDPIRPATVVSRPSLDHVVLVIDGVEAEQPVEFPDEPAVQVVRWQRDCCIVSASGSAKRLNIGDQLNVALRK